jgi:hypothetical protein
VEAAVTKTTRKAVKKAAKKAKPKKTVRDCIGILVFVDITSAQDGNDRALPLLRGIEMHAEAVGARVRLMEPFKVEARDE